MATPKRTTISVPVTEFTFTSPTKSPIKSNDAALEHHEPASPKGAVMARFRDQVKLHWRAIAERTLPSDALVLMAARASPELAFSSAFLATPRQLREVGLFIQENGEQFKLPPQRIVERMDLHSSSHLEEGKCNSEEVYFDLIEKWCLVPWQFDLSIVPDKTEEVQFRACVHLAYLEAGMGAMSVQELSELMFCPISEVVSNALDYIRNGGIPLAHVAHRHGNEPEEGRTESPKKVEDDPEPSELLSATETSSTSTVSHQSNAPQTPPNIATGVSENTTPIPPVVGLPTAEEDQPENQENTLHTVPTDCERPNVTADSSQSSIETTDSSSESEFPLRSIRNLPRRGEPSAEDSTSYSSAAAYLESQVMSTPQSNKDLIKARFAAQVEPYQRLKCTTTVDWNKLALMLARASPKLALGLVPFTSDQDRPRDFVRAQGWEKIRDFDAAVDQINQYIDTHGAGHHPLPRFITDLIGLQPRDDPFYLGSHEQPHERFFEIVKLWNLGAWANELTTTPNASELGHFRTFILLAAMEARRNTDGLRFQSVVDSYQVDYLISGVYSRLREIWEKKLSSPAVPRGRKQVRRMKDREWIQTSLAVSRPWKVVGKRS